ncbi:MAG: hypothetical protein WC989_00560 [Micavibrio sp.]
MILKSEDKQLKLADDGQILWQADSTNPLPGQAIARIEKGEALLKPRVTLDPALLQEGVDTDALMQKLGEWLERYVHFTLEPLFRLTGGEDLNDPARAIAEKLQGALGILPREELEEDIAKLDEEGRKALRARKVRMGPLLVFLPELNKPAAVRLRGVLLTLWTDKKLPAALPKDGIVSFSIADQTVDADYYRSIGYPVYGPRSIRVDMLDRVVCAVYEAASGGKFQAQHKMAEWLGSNILDLYAVLQAMGHTLIHDPAAAKAEAEGAVIEASSSGAPDGALGGPSVGQVETPAAPEETAVAVEEKPDSNTQAVNDTVEAVEGAEPAAVENAEAAETAETAEAAAAAAAGATEQAGAEAAAKTPVVVVKPELATFRLKRGKANESALKRPRREFAKKDQHAPGKQSFGQEKTGDKKPFKGRDGKRDDKRGNKRDKKQDWEDRSERVYSSQPKTLEDSPFAILQQLKLGNEKKN